METLSKKSSQVVGGGGREGVETLSEISSLVVGRGGKGLGGGKGGGGNTF